MAAEVIDATVTATTDVVAEVKSDDSKSGKKAKSSTKEKKSPRSRAPATHPPYLEVSVLFFFLPNKQNKKRKETESKKKKAF